MKIARIAALLVGTWAYASSASVQAQVALVEDVTGKPPGVGFMDYLDFGKVIHLGPRDSIVISYLSSCEREVIKGGIVTIGYEHSSVESGKVERTKLECESGKMLLAIRPGTESAGTVFRSIEPALTTKALTSEAPGQPQFTLYGSSPIVQVNGGGTLVITRLDRVERDHTFTIGPAQLVRGEFFDLAATRQSLTPGGIYRASWNNRTIVFKVHAGAKAGRTPIVGRLIMLTSAS